jgi:hypothetical protein
MYEILDKYDVELHNILIIDEFNIKDVQLKLPGIKHIWAGRLIRHKKELLDVREDKKLKLAAAIKSIQTNEIIKVNTLVAEKMANNCNQIKEINKTIEDLQLIIEFLEKVEKIMSSLSYDISNIIKIMQLEQT